MKYHASSTTALLALLNCLALANGVHDCDLICPANEVKQVCGSDGNTYQSKCLLKLKKCTSGKKLHVDHNGPCRPPPSCTKERQSVLQRIDNGELIKFGIFVPTCNFDGSFSALQCHGASESDVCWCVDKFGDEIDGTRVYGKKRPECRGQGRSPRSNIRLLNREKFARILKGCKKENRVSFNKKVVSSFKKQMSRLAKKKGPFDFVSVVQWKMNELDKNNDNQLEHKELKFLIKKLKKAYSPRKCGKTLFYYCDQDMNDVISKKEWFTCLGFGGSAIKYKTTPKSSLPKCATDYARAMKIQAKNPSPANFIPSCKEDGTFSPVQCQKLSGYCWCVDALTGKDIYGSAVQWAKPDCTKIVVPTTPKPTTHTTRRSTKAPHVGTEYPKKLKECDKKNWRRFGRELVKTFRGEFESITRPHRSASKNRTRNSGSISILADLSQKLPESSVLGWKFYRLDRNRDRMVSESELFAPYMRKTFGRIRRGRKCSRKLVNKCSGGKKRGISLREWKSCFRERASKENSYPTSRKPGFLGR